MTFAASQISLTQQSEAASLAFQMGALPLQAQRIEASLRAGLHGARKGGAGDDFWQYRRYQSGEDASRIDWRQSARQQGLYVREREWSLAQTLYLFVDQSASLRYRSQRGLPYKVERATLLGLTLAYAALQGGERLSLLAPHGKQESFSQQTPFFLGQAGRSKVATRLCDIYEQEAQGRAQEHKEETAWPVVHSLVGHAQCIWISDFLSSPQDLEKALEPFVNAGIKGHLIQVCDPAEESFPFEGRILFQVMTEAQTPEGGTEKEEELLSRAQERRALYLERFAAHRQEIKDITQNAGWECSFHRTDEAVTPFLYRFMNALVQR